MSCQLVKIDGSHLEGGGQILRTALTLSALRKIPIHVFRIRGGRSKPGLMEQHLKGIELIRDICNAEVKGASLGSQEIEFWPGEITGGSFKAHVRTAGSITLLLQVALPCTLFANSPTKLTLLGGTNTEMAPQIDYTTEVFRPILEKFGASFDCDLIKRGYFPKGGGEVIINVNPSETLTPINMTELGKVKKIYGWSYVAGSLPYRLCEQIAISAEKILKHYGNVDIQKYKETKNVAQDNATGIILVAETDQNCIIGATRMGKRNETCEDTGRNAAVEMVTTIRGENCVDEHAQDQIIIFMALAKGISRVKVGKITMHTKTAIFVVEKMTEVKFNIVSTGESSNIIECSGS